MATGPIPFVTVLEQRLKKLFDGGDRVRKEVAERLIKDSVWWLTHAHGPTRAPGFADRITGTEETWRVQFGANTFKLAGAVKACRRACIAWGCG